MLKNYRRRTISLSLAAFLLVVLKLGGITGCGGGSDVSNPNVNVGTGTGKALEDSGQTISSSMQEAFQGVSSGIAKSSQTIQCSPNGQATISGNASSGNPVTFNLAADFNECAGLDGTIQMSGEYSSTQTGDINANFTITGTVGGHGCAVTFNNFGAQVSGNSNAFTFSINGGMTATCGSATVTCTYNGVNAQDPAALQAACSCSGTGC